MLSRGRFWILFLGLPDGVKLWTGCFLLVIRLCAKQYPAEPRWDICGLARVLFILVRDVIARVDFGFCFFDACRRKFRAGIFIFVAVFLAFVLSFCW